MPLQWFLMMNCVLQARPSPLTLQAFLVSLRASCMRSGGIPCACPNTWVLVLLLWPGFWRLNTGLDSWCWDAVSHLWTVITVLCCFAPLISVLPFCHLWNVNIFLLDSVENPLPMQSSAPLPPHTQCYHRDHARVSGLFSGSQCMVYMVILVIIRSSYIWKVTDMIQRINRPAISNTYHPCSCQLGCQNVGVGPPLELLKLSLKLFSSFLPSVCP